MRPVAQSPARRRDPRLIGAAAGVALVALACAAPGGLWSGEPDGNLLQFQRYGEAIAGGAVPYRDLRLEYPPGAIPTFLLPAVGPDAAYVTFYRLLSATLAVVTATLAALLAAEVVPRPRRVAAAALSVGAASAALGSFVLFRFDFWPTALVLAALLLIVRGRVLPGVIALAVAALVKIYPLALLPLALLYVERRFGRRLAIRALLVFCGVGLVVLVPFALIDHVGLVLSIQTQMNRHLQLESGLASALLAAHHVASYEPNLFFDAGSWNVQGPLADRLASLHSILQAGAVVFVWAAFARSARGNGELVLASAAVVASAAFLGKVVSPQFLLWVVPLVPLLAGRVALAASALLAGALVLTGLLYPDRYAGLLALEGGPATLLVVRNLLLVAFTALLLASAFLARNPPPIVGRADGRDAEQTG